MVNDWVHDRNKPPIFWLSGMAGTGKSTIAKTFAQSLDGPNPKYYLGASFFCSRDDERLSRDHLIIPNLAYQLAQFDAGIQVGVTKSLREDKRVADLDIEYQFQKLIVEPLQSSKTEKWLIVIVVDALDECGGRPEEIVALFASLQITSLPFSVKLFVTGRPEAKIRQALAQSKVKRQVQPLQLHEIKRSIVRGDIETYLDYYFELMVEVRPHLPKGWPAKSSIEALRDLAGDLFIFAATAIKFIGDPEEDPEEKLALILTNVHLHGQIDLLYKQVLDTALHEGRDAGLLKKFQDVMGTVVCLKEPLTIRGLRMLLGIPSSSVKKVMTRLYSVVITPDIDDEHIRLIHPSFPDYLTDERRCTEKQYFIDKSNRHADIAYLALQHMRKMLKRNICELEDPMVLNEEIMDLPGLLAFHIPSHLRYSCFYWASHLCSVDPTDVLLDLLHSFVTTKLLAWLEVLVLYQRVDTALACIRSVQTWLSVKCTRKLSNTIDILKNMDRFIEQFRKLIGICVGNIYASTLPFTPSCPLLDMYNHERSRSGTVVAYSGLEWNQCLSIMRGHVDQVNSVAFSASGANIASGSNDATIRIWDSTTTKVLAILKGHSDCISSVKFSSDGSKIVSGAGDHTVRIWNSRTGGSLAILKGHSRWVTSVAFSPDGLKVISGSNDKTMRICNWTTGETIAIFSGHEYGVNSVAFSYDGSKVVSGSIDTTLQVWSVTTEEMVAHLKGHSHWVSSVAFSPDGLKVVSGSVDATLRIWGLTTCKSLATLRGHSEWVTSVTFSPDGSKVVSGSRDATVRIWDSVTGEPLSILIGHSRGVTSVAFSSDGLKIVSGSLSRTIWIWDSAKKGKNNTHQNSDSIAIARFSPDSTSVTFFRGFGSKEVVWKWISTELDKSVTHASQASLHHGVHIDYQNGWIISPQTQKKYCQIPDAFTRRVMISVYGPLAALIDDSGNLYVLELSPVVCNGRRPSSPLSLPGRHCEPLTPYSIILSYLAISFKKLVLISSVVLSTVSISVILTRFSAS